MCMLLCFLFFLFSSLSWTAKHCLTNTENISHSNMFSLHSRLHWEGCWWNQGDICGHQSIFPRTHLFCGRLPCKCVFYTEIHNVVLTLSKHCSYCRCWWDLYFTAFKTLLFFSSFCLISWLSKTTSVSGNTRRAWLGCPAKQVCKQA